MCRPNKEPSTQTGDAVSDEVCGQADAELVGEAAGVRLVEVSREILRPDDVVGIRQSKSGVLLVSRVLAMGRGRLTQRWP